MKTKPPSAGAPPASASPSHRRRPPSASAAPGWDSANDKESSHGKYAGISPESVRCTSEQFGADNLSNEACSALAEDLSYKLRQLIHNVALHARHARTPRVEVEDVNAVLRLMDTEPVLGPGHAQWVPIMDSENYCTPLDPEIDVISLATKPQTLYCIPPPSIAVTWISDSRNSPMKNNGISPTLQNYFTKISSALFSADKKLVKVALQDLSSNTHIGPIIPSIINLALSILSEVSSTPQISNNLIHKQALNILDCLLVNPCCCDTDVSQQLHRLFPILVTYVLTESVYTQKILRIMASVVKIWPQFAYIGRNSVLEFLSKGVEERLTGPLVECLSALGRKALIDALLHRMPLIELMLSMDGSKQPSLYDALLNSSSVFLKAPKNNDDSRNIYIDECLYELLGDSIIPSRIFNNLPDKAEERPLSPKIDFDVSPYSPLGPPKKRKIKIIKYFPHIKREHKHNGNPFEPSVQQQQRHIRFNVPGCRQLATARRNNVWRNDGFQNGGRYGMAADKKISVTVANGALLRFKYRLPRDGKPIPSYGLYAL